jgi:hypothetical protein
MHKFPYTRSEEFRVFRWDASSESWVFAVTCHDEERAHSYIAQRRPMSECCVVRYVADGYQQFSHGETAAACGWAQK